MKKYMRRALECTALVVILAMLGGCIAAFAGASVKSARDKLTSLLDMAEALYGEGTLTEEQLAQSCAESDVRATLIDLDGNVIYDSEASGDMENHSEREEFKTALNGGTGFAQRTSESMGSSMICRFAERA